MHPRVAAPCAPASRDALPGRRLIDQTFSWWTEIGELEHIIIRMLMMLLDARDDLRSGVEAIIMFLLVLLCRPCGICAVSVGTGFVPLRLYLIVLIYYRPFAV